MDDLHLRAAALLHGPYILGQPSRLIHCYVTGELWDDPGRSISYHAVCKPLSARIADATSGPARNARLFYQRTTEPPKESSAELAARQQ
jgi:hypothetical protein